MPELRKCIIDGCSNMREARGMCRKHYVAWRRASLTSLSEANA